MVVWCVRPSLPVLATRLVWQPAVVVARLRGIKEIPAGEARNRRREGKRPAPVDTIFPDADYVHARPDLWQAVLACLQEAPVDAATSLAQGSLDVV